MPTFNRQRSLERTLRGLVGQVGVEHGVDRGVEVVVVSDGSTDGTDAYLASGTTPVPVVAITQPNGGPAAARNRGIEVARGTLVLFLDDDVAPAPDVVEAHLRRHDGPDDDLVVIGPMLTPDDFAMSPWVRWEQAMLVKQYDAMDRGDYEATARQFYTGNASVAMRHLRAAGGFDPSFRRAEDVELAYRLEDRGLRFAYEPAAVVHHYAERSFDSWIATAAAYGRNDAIFARDHGRRWLLDSIGREFGGRNRLVQALTRACLPRPRLAAGAAAGLSLAARGACRIGDGHVAAPVLSGAYNLAYYRGLADELGDPRAVLRGFDGQIAATKETG